MLVGVVGKRGDDRATDVVRDLLAHLQDAGVSVVLEESTRESLGEEPAVAEVAVDDGTPAGAGSFPACDLVVSVGGDGTFLFAARRSGSTPVLGVNLGEVGFLNVVQPGEAVAVVEDVLAEIGERGTARTTELPRLGARGEGLSVTPAVNEVVLQGPRRGRGHGIDLEVHVDGAAYAECHADGVLIATANGSTAYNLSEGGPLVHPAVGGLIVNGMSDEGGLGPLVVREDSEITVTLENADRAYVVSDGRETAPIDPPTTITVERAGSPVAVAGPPRDFFAALDKLD